MPEETVIHEGTWLQWPHHYTYGTYYRNSLDETWVKMTSALVTSENVHIVAYNETEKERIIALLDDADIPLSNIDFFIHQTNDVWIRDNGPMFVYDENNELTILDWGFNGWGYDTPYSKCDKIPESISADIEIPVIDLNAVVLEGGAIEHDGNGTMIATRSSVTHSSRNPNLTEGQMEEYISTYMGISNFIWLDGLYGSEITDMHIDGFLRFVNENTLLTLNEQDLQYWELSSDDVNTIQNARNIHGEAYSLVTVPLTKNNVRTANGMQLNYKGSYCNYYVANTVVLVPNYSDPNDGIANSIIQELYPTRTVIGIDVRNLYEYGGMVHCVTQQQPIKLEGTELNTHEIQPVFIGDFYPNPASSYSLLTVRLDKAATIEIILYDMQGRKIYEKATFGFSGKNRIEIKTSSLKKGVYTCQVNIDKQNVGNGKLIVK
jgi:agmatine deiminase